NPARHRRDGSAPDRDPGRFALCRRRLGVSARGRRDRPLRQLRRRPDRRRRGGLRRGVPRQLPRQCDVRRARECGSGHARAGERDRSSCRALRRDDWPRRHRRRIVAVVRPEMLASFERVCAKWELPCTPIGTVTDDGILRALCDDGIVGEIPAAVLTDECPRYELDVEPAQPKNVSVSPLNIVPKKWIYEQYDQLVGSRTVRRPGFDAAVLRLRPSLRGIAVALQGPPPGERDPFRAGVLAVLGAARNVACAGGEPLALTDCLNFGSPEKPEVAWELQQAIEGIAQAA